MKTNKIRYGIFGLFLLIFAGCAPENELITNITPVTEGEMVTVRFTATIPDFHTVQTRANGGVNDMYLLVFNESGSFLKRVAATLSNQTDQGGEFTASLPASTNARTVHFICNYDWADFSDTEMLYKNEAAVIATMSTQNATFWAREELPSGINTNSFNAPKIVDILRNQAKISVVNGDTSFTYKSFAIQNAPNKGTVAPFNTSTAQFTTGSITEPMGVSLIPATTSDFSTTEKYLFERKNANSSNITTVIVKGTYSGTDYYYKIDLVDADKKRYDIERNWHYKVTINSVSSVGYANLSDALSGAAHNNTVLDPIIEKYPMISDGTSMLEVEKTLVILTQPGQTFDVWYKYFPNINNTTVNNTGVTVTLQSGSEGIATWSFDNTTGKITATAVSGSNTESKEAKFIVTKGDLARSVRVILRTPFSFESITINNANPGTVSNGQSQNAQLKFNIPNDFPEDLLPLPIKIYTQGLYAAATGLELEVENGQIYYVYRATAKGEQTVNFKTNKSENVETVTLKADYFTDGSIYYDTFARINGSITYGAANASVPLGTNLPFGASIIASTGAITVNSNGAYVYTYPFGTSVNTSVTFTYTKLVSTGFKEEYTYVSTIANLRNSPSIAMNLTNFIFESTIVYSTTSTGSTTNVAANTTNNNNNNANNNIIITGTPAITGYTFSMVSAGNYRLTIPYTVNDPSITFRYRRNNGTNVYYATKTLSELKTNNSIRVVRQ